MCGPGPRLKPRERRAVRLAAIVKETTVALAGLKPPWAGPESSGAAGYEVRATATDGPAEEAAAGRAGDGRKERETEGEASHGKSSVQEEQE